MTTLATTIKLALLIQYPDNTNQSRVKLLQFDDYWLVFAVYFMAAIVSQARRVVGRVRRMFTASYVFNWVVIPYGPG